MSNMKKPWLSMSVKPRAYEMPSCAAFGFLPLGEMLPHAGKR